jgi:hypothetical protein
MLNFSLGESFNYQDLYNQITVSFLVSSGSLEGLSSFNTNQYTGALIVNPVTSGSITVTASKANFYLYFNNVFVASGMGGGTYNFTAGSIFAISWTYDSTIPPIIPTGTTTLYFRGDIYSFNSTLTGYGLDITNTNLPTPATLALGIGSVYFGYRVWLLHQRGNMVELTSGAPVAVSSRLMDSAGYQSSYWTPQETIMVLGYDRFIVVTYISNDEVTWVPKVTSISHTFLTNKLYASPWNFTVYTSLVGATGTFVFGDSATANSRIEGVSFRVPLPQEIALFYGTSGDFIGMVLLPYTYLIGNLIYSLAFLLVGGSFYLKHKRWEVLLVLVVLFGSFQGSMLLLPDVVYRIILIIVILIITVVLYKLFR